MKLLYSDPQAANYIPYLYHFRLEHCMYIDTEKGIAVVTGKEFVGKNWPLIDHTVEPITADPTKVYRLHGEAKLEYRP